MLVATTGGMGAINTVIKLGVRRPRPLALAGIKQAGGYSFPSGHSSGSFVFFGALVYLIWREARHRALALSGLSAATVVTAMVGRSRVRLRAHYLTDVLAGFALGALWLAIIIRAFGPRLNREAQR
jgi:undecaprenyl-diphosphatase